jgi:adenylate cyclase
MVSIKNKKKFTVKFQLSFMILLLCSVFTTAAIVHFPWIYTSKKNISSVVYNLNQEIMNGISREVKRLFNNTLTTQQTIQDVLSNELISLEDRDQLGKLYLTLLQSNDNISWVSFGWPNGDFFGAQRENKNSIKLVYSKWEGETEKATRKIDFYEPQKSGLHFISTHVIKNYMYYAPQRSWYKKAIASRDHVWTDVYIFSTSKKPGINSAISFEKNGEFVGVISIAIELNNISEYLKTINVADTGTAFIMNAGYELVAFQNPNEITHRISGQGNPKLKKVSESNNKYIKAANQIINLHNIDTGEIKEAVRFEYKDNKNGKFFVSFAPVGYLNWTICTVIPEDDFLEEINRNKKNMLIIMLILFCLTAILSALVSKKLFTKPIIKLTNQTKHVQNMELKRIKKVSSVIQEIDSLSNAMVQMSNGLMSFNKYLPTELVRTLIKQGIEAELGGVEKTVTIFFSDLVSFTKASEKYGNKLIPHLGECLSNISKTIGTERGIIDKFIGDAVMAFWGAPLPNKNHAIDACRAALHSQELLRKLRMIWESDEKHPFKMRIGLNTGAVIVGNIGSEERMDYTVLGDPVNLASRLEALNKIYGTSILIGEETYINARYAIIARKIDTVAVYGKEEGIIIYELLAMKDELSVSDKFDWIHVYEEALELYKSRQWEKALSLFEKTIVLRGGTDQPSSLFIKNCNKCIENPPEASQWNEITVMDCK